MVRSGWSYGIRTRTRDQADPWLTIPGATERRPALYPSRDDAMTALALSGLNAPRHTVVIAHVTEQPNADFEGGYAFIINEPGAIVDYYGSPAQDHVCFIIQSIGPDNLFVLTERDYPWVALADVAAHSFSPNGERAALCAHCRHETAWHMPTDRTRCSVRDCSCAQHTSILAADQPIPTPVRYKKLKHNHPAEAFGALRAPGECPRCDQRRAERAIEGLTDHNHERLPFGQRKAFGECPRCDELHNGARPRRSRAEQDRRDDEQRAREIRMHDCRASGCGSVCTFGQW